MRKILTLILLMAVSAAAWGQKADMRKGNRSFRKGDYASADISYRKALLKDSSSVAGKYNLADNLYRQENFDEAARVMDSAREAVADVPFQASYWFNRGDIAIAKQDWQTAVDSFKECLKITPEDMDAKKNYVYARNKLQEQQQEQQQQQQQDQDQNQDQNQNQDQQQDQNQDQDQQEEQSQPQSGQEPQISPQQAQQLLQAIQEKERQTQEKVDEKKAAALKSRQKEKNW
ncbi:MAG: tetratricopeptide repeat protein [Bacteroidales bacterium]|nr:tetratricopeptide repeat protein [Bacteroidales bacterium]